MLNYVSTILKSSNPNLILMKITVILGIILLFIWIHKKTASPHENKQEGFTQKEQFVLKQNQDVYDDFYAEVYDGLNDTQNRSQKELVEIIKMTEPTKNSVFLDVGSGTGYIVHALHDAGYQAYGIEKSQDMIDYAEKINPDASYKNGDVMDSMTFEHSTFTHVICINFTVYLFENKLTFFRNCYYWMKPNGYLILHLVEPNKFNIVSPTQNPYAGILSNNVNMRKTDKTVEFYDFKYSASYKDRKNDNNSKCVTFKETFVDRNTNHVRQNEQTLYMDNIDDILKMASKSGFIFHGKSNMKESKGDEHQYMYIFERPM